MTADTPDPLDLGCFSVSLAVQDLEASLAFYGALGFTRLGGDDNYAIVGHGTTIIGLFHGMFESNILTFNPGLEPPGAGGSDAGATTTGEEGEVPGRVEEFTDIRVIEQRLLAAGVELTRRTESDAGPDHITLVDPDGNEILIDQFF